MCSPSRQRPEPVDDRKAEMIFLAKFVRVESGFDAFFPETVMKMKKSFAVRSVLAASTAVSAQSGITLYGVVEQA